MEKLTLVVLAAGMGSRFGGQKQTEGIDGRGHILLDYSLHDAILSGFGRALFIIRKEMKDSFLSIVSGKGWFSKINVDFIFQDISDLPSGFKLPEIRSKPWGTAHAISCLFGKVYSPFAVINADDFYGREAISKIAKNLQNGECSMVGYNLCNTLSSYGAVSRGICEIKGGYLTEIVEKSGIINSEGKIIDREGSEISPTAKTSMNLWGFTPEIADEAKDRFAHFLKENLAENPGGCEYYLPSLVSSLIKEKKLKVRVINTDSKWYGLTYKKDKSEVSLALEKMISDGIYPSIL